MAGAERKYLKPEISREPLAIVPPSTTNLRQHEEQARITALSEKAYRALHVGFVALPLVAGIDKFTNVLTDWSQYLAPSLPGALGLGGGAFLLGVGVFEIAMALGMVLKPRLFADIFSAYCVAIIANLLLTGEYFDVALFNFALAAGACGLARLSSAKERGAFDEAHDDLGRNSTKRTAA